MKLVSYRNVILGLVKHRLWLNGTYLEYIFILLAFSMVTMLLTNWTMLNITDQIFTSEGGGDATAGFLWLNYISPGTNLSLGHTDMVNYPVGENLGSSTFVTYSLLWLPLRYLSTLFNPIIALNIVTFLGFLLSAISGYWLMKRLTGSVFASFLAGYTIAFVPYSVAKSSTHLSYIFNVCFVLIVASYIAFWTKPTYKRAVIFGISMTAPLYVDGYFTLIVPVLGFALVTSGFIFDWLSGKAAIIFTKLKRLLLACMTFIFIVSPIVYVQFSHGSQIKSELAGARSSISSEFELYQTEMIDLILPVDNPFLLGSQKYIKAQNIKNLRSNPSENANYVGIVVSLMCVAGFALCLGYLIRKEKASIASLSDKTKNMFLFMSTITFVSATVMLSFIFSPYINVFGLHIPMMGQLLLDLNITYWRVLSRFFMPLHVLLSVYAVFSAWILISMVSKLKSRTILIKTVFLCLLVFTAAEYLTTANRPSFSFTRVPETYKWLASQKQIQVIAELPLVNGLSPLTGDYLTNQITHGKKLINSRTNTPSIQGFYGTFDNPETIDYVKQQGAQAVVIRSKHCDTEYSWGSLLHSEQVSNPLHPYLCTYRINETIRNDGLYAEISQGILGTPLFSDTYELTSVIETGIVRIDIKKINRPNARRAEISGVFVPVLAPSFSGKWYLYQSNKIVNSGNISESQGTIDHSVIDANKPLYIKVVDRGGAPVSKHTIGLQNLVVDGL